MKTKILLSVMAIVMAVAMITGGTMAWFTDTATNTGNTFTAGTVDVALGGAIDFSLPNMAPGDVSAPQYINIYNNGSLDMIFRMYIQDVSGLKGLKDQLWVRITGAPTDVPDGAKVTGSWVHYGATNNVLTQSLPYHDADGFVPLWTLVGSGAVNLMDNAVAHFLAPNGDGIFHPNYVAQYKFEVKLSKDAGNGYMGGTYTGKIIVDGTQAAHQTDKDHVQY